MNFPLSCWFRRGHDGMICDIFFSLLFCVFFSLRPWIFSAHDVLVPGLHWRFGASPESCLAGTEHWLWRSLPSALGPGRISSSQVLVEQQGPFRWTQVEDQVNPVNPGSPWLFVWFFPEDRKEVVVKTLRKGCFLSSAPWQIHQDGVFSFGFDVLKMFLCLPL